MEPHDLMHVASQLTLGDKVLKHSGRKIRKLAGGALGGFAGARRRRWAGTGSWRRAVASSSRTAPTLPLDSITFPYVYCAIAARHTVP